MFFDDLDQYNERIALYDGMERTMTYRKLLETADGIAAAVGERCVVFSMCRNCTESVAGYVGFLRHQIAPVLINDAIDATLLQHLLDVYHPAYFYLPAQRAAEMMGDIVYRTGAYVLVKLSGGQNYGLAPELALLLTTSGSTGSPKLVRQSYRNLQSNTASIIEYLGIVPEDRAITTLPMSYTYGLSILNTHLSAGASLILTDTTLLDKEFWALFKEQKATTFGGVPYVYEMLQKLRFARMDLPSLRYLTQAGGKLSKELAEEFSEICTKKGIQLIVMYGQTEATARMSYLPWEYAQSKAGSMGIAIPGGKFWLADLDGKPIEEPEMTGELMYCGDNVTLGYAESSTDLAHGDDNHGTLQTGDMAQRDADGFYYIVGRKKRFLKLFGNRVNLDEVEGLLKQQGFDCACAGEDDHLYVYITDEGSAAVVSAFLTEHTGISHGGFQIITIDKIPRNEAGKVLYSALEGPVS